MPESLLNGTWDTDEANFEKLLAEEARIFEQTLNQKYTRKQAYERMNERAVFYSKQSEVRTERARALGLLVKKQEKEGVSGSVLQRITKRFDNKKNKNRKFEAAGLDKMYQGPVLSLDDNRGGEDHDINSAILAEQKTTLLLLKYYEANKDKNLLNIDDPPRVKDYKARKEEERKQREYERSQRMRLITGDDDDDENSVEGFSTKERENVSNQMTEEEKRARERRAQLREKLLSKRPVFLGEDGTLFDLYYRPIPNQDIDRHYRGKFSKMYESKTNGPNFGQPVYNENESEEEQFARLVETYEYCHDPEFYSSLPSPNEYTDFNEYEKALIRWSKQAQRKLGYLQLPRPMGRHYYRPVYHADFKTGKGTSNRSHSNLNPFSGSFSSIDMFEAMEETWESHLVPLEPKPEFYAHFEEYEAAVLRWASVNMGLPFLPPHAAQFQFLAGLKIQNHPKHQIAGLSKNSNLDEDQRGTEDYDHNEDVYSSDESSDDTYLDEKSKKLVLLNQWDDITEENQLAIREAISRTLEAKQKAKQRHKGPYHYRMLPKIHGEFADDYKTVKVMTRVDLSNLQISISPMYQPKQSEGVKPWIQAQRLERSLKKVYAKKTGPFLAAISEDLLHQRALRRTDLTGEELRNSYDCETWMQDRKVTFKIPEFDIGELVFEMFTHQSYVRYLQILLIRMDNGHRYDRLNSWYHPKEIVTDEHFHKMNTILYAIEHPSQITPDHVRAIFITNVYLDNFYVWLDHQLREKMPIIVRNGELREELMLETNKQLLTVSMNININMALPSEKDRNQDNFRALINLFSDCDDKLVHAKVSVFVMEFMKTNKSEDRMRMLIKHTDLQSLFLVASAVSFCDEVPVELYQYNTVVQHLVKQIIDEGVDKFICDVMVFYYLDCICVSLLEEDSLYPQVYPLLIQELEKNIERIVSYLHRNSAFLSTNIWTLLGHRSKQLSELGWFLLTILLFLSEMSPNVRDLLRHDNTMLVKNLRELATSKLKHVQHYVARIFPTLEQRHWKSLLTDAYSNMDVVVSDLIVAAETHALKSQPPLISSVVLEFLLGALSLDETDDKEGDSLAMRMIESLISSKGFQRILHEILQTGVWSQMRQHQGTILGAMFLSKFAKYLVCKSMVRASKGTLTNTTATGTSANSNASQGKGPETGQKQKKGLMGLLRVRGNKNPEPSSPRRQPSLPFATTSETEFDTSVRYEVTVVDLNAMLDFICQAPDARNRYVYRPRVYLLQAFRYLVKCPSIYNILPQDKVFFTKILNICSDGQDMEFNRNAWCLFYQLIKFHSNTLELLIKFNLLSNFVELVGSVKNSAVTTNSLHYFSKILNLPKYTGQTFAVGANGNEIPKTKAGFNIPDLSVTKEYEKNVNKLIDLMQSKNLYFAFHHAYTRLSKDYKGWPFQSLVKFYNTLNTSPICQRMVTQFKKQSKEFKDGLEQIASIKKE